VPGEFLPHHLQNLMRRPRADVSGEQYIFQFREQRGIDLLFAETRSSTLATICDRVFETDCFSRSSNDPSPFLKMENIAMRRPRAPKYSF